MIRSLQALLIALALLAPLADLAAQDVPERRARVEVARRGWLGFSYDVLDGARLRVMDVLPESPAARAGMQEGDTIVRWNGQPAEADAVMRSRLEPGQTVQLRVRRGGRDRDLAVVAGDRPSGPNRVFGTEDEDVIVLNPGPLVRAFRIQADSLGMHADSLQRRLRVLFRDSLGPRLREMERLRIELPRVEVREMEREGERVFAFGVGARGIAGAEFADLNQGLSEYFGTDRGVVALRVGPETPAARAGLQAGDVVVRANGYGIERIADLRQAVSRDEDRTVELEIIRKGQSRKIQMRWE